jgi:hypothetical protein
MVLGFLGALAGAPLQVSEYLRSLIATRYSEKSAGPHPGRTRPTWPTSDVGHLLGLAEELGAGGQPSAVFADVFDILKFPFAKMLFVNFVFFAAIFAGQRLPLGIAQVSGFFRQGPTGGADIGLRMALFSHGFLLKSTVISA